MDMKLLRIHDRYFKKVVSQYLTYVPFDFPSIPTINYNIVGKVPPSTRMAAPLVADASSLDK